MFDPAKPFNELPLLPPSVKLETEPVLKQLVRSSSALASLKEAGKRLPDRSVVLKSMVLQDAKLSSEIENIVTTNDELYHQIESDEANQSPQVREIRRYSHALWRGYEMLQNRGVVDLGAILEVASLLLEEKAELRSGPGTRIGSRTSGQIVYTPPTGEERLRGLLTNLLEFVDSHSAIDPLIRIGAAHYQFEAIHPFRDGNGRTGRVLNILFMVQHGLLDLPLLYLSQEFLNTRRDYYRGLRDVTEKESWENWLLYFLECVEATAIVTRRQLGMIESAMAEAEEAIRRKLPRTFPIRIAELIFRKPYVRIGDLVAEGIAQRQAASNYLRKLAAIGLLEQRREWRDALFLNRKLLQILSLSEEP